MENTVVCSVYCLWGKTAPAPRLWATVSRGAQSSVHAFVLHTLTWSADSQILYKGTQAAGESQIYNSAQARAAAESQVGQAYSFGAAAACGWPLSKASLLPRSIHALDSVVIGTYLKRGVK